MNEKDLDLIELFLAKQLTGSELNDFEHRLEQEPELMEALATRQKMDQFLNYKAGSAIQLEQINSLNQEFFQTKKPTIENVTPSITRRKWITVAAGIALIVASIFLLQYMLRPSIDDQQLYQRFAHHTSLDIVTKGTDNCPNADLLQSLYNSNQFEKALPYLNNCLSQVPNDLVLQLAKGICLMETSSYEEANSIFSQLSAGSSLLRIEGIWYHSLSYIKEGNRTAAINLLKTIPDRTDRYEEAQKLLKLLK